MAYSKDKELIILKPLYTQSPLSYPLPWPHMSEIFNGLILTSGGEYIALNDI